jgi:hypothetical protein
METPNPTVAEMPIETAAQLTLYLIMCLPDEGARVSRVKDFCRLYEIKEKRASEALASARSEQPLAPEPTENAEFDRVGRLFHKK